MEILKLLDDYVPTATSTESVVRMQLERPVKGEDGNIGDWKKEDVNARFLHGAIGLVTETGELEESIYKAKWNKEKWDTVNVIEECGDVIWYLAIVVDSLGLSFVGLDVQSAWIDKNIAISRMIISADQIIDKAKRNIFYGKPLEEDAVKRELGNLIGAMDCLCKHADGSIEQAIDKVTYKLTKVRFKDGFNQEDAYNRDLKEERDALESK